MPENQEPECIIAACMKPKLPEMREAVRFAERYVRQPMQLSQEKCGSIDEIRAYISNCEMKIAKEQSLSRALEKQAAQRKNVRTDR